MMLRGCAIALALSLGARAQEKPADPPLELVPLVPLKAPWMKKKEKPRPPPLERPQTAKKAPPRKKPAPAQVKKEKQRKPEAEAVAPFVAAPPPAVAVPATPPPPPVAVEVPAPKPPPEVEPPPLVKAEIVPRPAPAPAMARTAPAAPPAPQRGWTRPAGLVSLGLGAAAAAAGMVFGARSKSDLDAAEKSFQANGGVYRPGDLGPLHSGNSKAHTANALFVAAGLLAGAGLLLTFAF
jgi:hypothetical protein